MNRARALLLCSWLVLGAISFSFGAPFAQAGLDDWSETLYVLAVEHPEIPQPALIHALKYLDEHQDLVTNRDYMTIIDFDQPSTVERMHVIDLKTQQASSYLVAHGKGSGQLYATKFSNRPNSNMSSLGIYLTGEPYYGEHGLSMRLKGQDPTNSNAEARAIVMHSADYVSYDFIAQRGRLGLSWGCPAVSPLVSNDLVRKLQNGSVFFIYHSPVSRKHLF